MGGKKLKNLYRPQLYIYKPNKTPLPNKEDGSTKVLHSYNIVMRRISGLRPDGIPSHPTRKQSNINKKGVVIAIKTNASALALNLIMSSLITGGGEIINFRKAILKEAN